MLREWDICALDYVSQEWWRQSGKELTLTFAFFGAGLSGRDGLPRASDSLNS